MYFGSIYLCQEIIEYFLGRLLLITHSLHGWIVEFHITLIMTKALLITRDLSNGVVSEEFEFKANSLGAHIETHEGLILRMFSCLTVNSQDDSQAICFLFLSLYLTISAVGMQG